MTGSDDPHGLSAAAEIAAHAFREQPGSSPGVPAILHGAEWHRFSVPPTHPACNSIALLTRMQEASDYNLQGNVLRQLQRRGDPAYNGFIANYMLTREPGSNVYCSCASWTENLPTFLPATDMIGLVRLAGDSGLIARVRWEELTQAHGHMFRPMGLNPERYFVMGFLPDDVVRDWLRVPMPDLARVAAQTKLMDDTLSYEM